MTDSCIGLLTGPVGAGKTTIAARVVGLARQRGIACRGLLAPALHDAGGQKVGIVGLDLATDERRILARTDCDLGGPRLGPYSFDAAVLEWATDGILAAMASPPQAVEGEGKRLTLVVVDEIGKLELWHDQGLAPVLPALAAGPAARALVIVRESLIEELHERLGEVEQVVFRASQQNRDGLPAEIVEALLQAGA